MNLSEKEFAYDADLELYTIRKAKELCTTMCLQDNKSSSHPHPHSSRRSDF